RRCPATFYLGSRRVATQCSSGKSCQWARPRGLGTQRTHHPHRVCPSQTVSLRSSSHRRTAPFRERRQKLLRTDDQKHGQRPLERNLVDRDALLATKVRRTPHRQRFYAATIMAAHTTQKPQRARSQLHYL